MPTDGWSRFAVEVCQVRAITSVDANLAAICAAIAQAGHRGADVVVFPELATVDPVGDASTWARATTDLEDVQIQRLAASARDAQVAVICGVIEAAEPLPFNTVIALDRHGDLLGRYRKMHLYDALGVRESDRMQPGDAAPVTVDIAGVRVGLLTCYDLRFPELARALTVAGAECLVVPAAWYDGPGKLDQWSVLTAARAVENTVFMVAADQCSAPFIGSSRILDPRGETLAAAGAEPTVISAELSRDHLVDVRTTMPSLSHRRL